MPRCWLSIGSNQEREASIRGAIADLGSAFGDLILSSIYESPAAGFTGEPFLNLVAGIDTTMTVGAISRILRAIEDAHGRLRGPDKFAPRTLDIDLLTYGQASGTLDGREVPRDEILRYAFVLGPLAEVAPDEIHPGIGQTYSALFAASAARFALDGQSLTRVARR